MRQSDIQQLIDRHIAETSAGLRDCPVNELTRGQCTVRNHFILKIDICNSTSLLHGRRAQTYARFMHPFFATMDAITRDCGADSSQTEYHGDSVLSLFPERGNVAMDVITAATRCHYAFRLLVRANPDFRGLEMKTRSVVHFGALSVVVTGPYGESHRAAVGVPIHLAAKREKLVDPGTIWVSDTAANQLPPAQRNTFLTRIKKTEKYTETVPDAQPTTDRSSVYNALYPNENSPTNALAAGLSGAGLIGSAMRPNSVGSLLAAALGRSAGSEPALIQQRTRTREVNDGWRVNMLTTCRELGLTLPFPI